MLPTHRHFLRIVWAGLHQGITVGIRRQALSSHTGLNKNANMSGARGSKKVTLRNAIVWRKPIR